MNRIAAVSAAIALSFPAGAARADSFTVDYVAETCFACHRSGATGAIPPITGRPGFEISRALSAYKSGERKNGIMNAIAEDLEPTMIGMLSTYLAKQR